MKLLRGVFALILCLAVFGLCVQGQTCASTINLKQDPSSTSITYTNSTTFTVTDVNQLLCITLTLNNIVGTTWSVTFPGGHDNATATLTYNLLDYDIASGGSVYLSVDSYNRLPTGQEFTSDWVLVGPDIPTPYDITVFLRADNADMAVVNNTLFTWSDAVLPQWSGSIFFSDVNPAHSKKECQRFSYSYRLDFPLGTSRDLLVTTTGLDTARGQLFDFLYITAGTTDSVIVHGNFTASKGYYEFRLISEIEPVDGPEQGPFEIRATSISLVPTMCSNKPKNNGLSTGQLIGIIVGSAVIGLILIVILGCLIAQCRKKKDGYESFD